MLGGHTNVAMAKWVSDGTPHIQVVQLGFIPDFAIVITNARGTNPNMHFWAGTAFSLLAAADSAILDTGSTGVLTIETSAIAAYTGDDTVSATDVTNSKYVDQFGNVSAANTITSPGLTIPAALLTASGYNFLIAFRNDL